MQIAHSTQSKIRILKFELYAKSEIFCKSIQKLKVYYLERRAPASAECAFWELGADDSHYENHSTRGTAANPLHREDEREKERGCEAVALTISIPHHETHLRAFWLNLNSTMPCGQRPL